MHYYKIKRICFNSIDGVNSLTTFGPNLAILIWADTVQLSRADSDPRAEVVIYKNNVNYHYYHFYLELLTYL